MPRKSRHLVLPAAAALFLSACGGTEDVGTPASSTATSVTGSATGSSTSEVDTVPVEFPREPIARIPSAVDGVDLEVYRLVRLLPETTSSGEDDPAARAANRRVTIVLVGV